jgi:nucleotide-binding universal stress UspA family protein
MDKCIILAVDGEFSRQTQHALRTAGDLFAQAALGLHFILLTVIPLPYDPSPALMKSRGIGQCHPPSPTSQQRRQATEVLSLAGALLQRQGFALALLHVELVQRFGDPADEIVKVARQRWADYVVLGRRGNSSMHQLRRVFVGSISSDVMRTAPCPVLLVTPPPIPRPHNLLAWRTRGETGRVKG